MNKKALALMVIAAAAITCLTGFRSSAAEEEKSPWRIKLEEKAQEPAKEPLEAALKSLDAIDITTKDIFDETAFDPAAYDYEVTVQSDIYGVLVKAEPDNDYALKVTADKSAYTYTGDYTYKSGKEIEFDENLGGYLVLLDQSHGGYDAELIVTVTIEASKEGAETQTYKLVITRECDNEIYDKFEEGIYEYTLEDGTVYPVEYNLYKPAGYGETDKKYPVFVCLHGGGQCKTEDGGQSADMILKRYQMATIWAKDSEADPDKECIVLAAHVDRNYSAGWESGAKLEPAGIATYELLQGLIEEGFVDTDRIYIGGCSMGGIGTYTFLQEYPDLFAGALITCGPIAEGFDASRLAPLSGHLYIAHAIDDPVCKYEDAYVPATEALKEAGIEFETKVYEENVVFYPTGHFSWVPAFADESIREWLFAQSK